MRAGRHKVALEQQRVVAARMRAVEGRELDPPPRLDVPLMWPVVALVPTAPIPTAPPDGGTRTEREDTR